LIKEIIQTVSLIPDHITRSVYAKELSTQFEMDENMVSNELIRLRKNSLANELNEPIIRDVKVVNDNVSILPTQSKEELTYEFELIRIMLQFGTNEIETIQGDELRPQKVSVVEMICQELTNDELSFRHPICHKIHTVFVEGLNEQTVYSMAYFQHLEDQELIKFISNLETFESELSPNWIVKYNIFTKTEEMGLFHTVSNLLYNFKYNKVNEHILSLQTKMKDASISHDELMDMLAEQMAYERVKKEITGHLGRIILR
jgi:DNA primase